MKKLVSAVLALIIVATCAVSLASCSPDNSKGTIAVCAKGESHAFWQAVKAGAMAAGEKYGYKITFAGPDDETSASISQQQAQISAAIANKNLKGMVLATIGTGYIELLKELKDKNIPVVQFDSGVFAADIAALDAAGKNPIVASVATSNVLAAALGAEKMYEALRAEIDAATAAAPYVIGVIQHDETQTGIDRATGFRDKMVALAGNKVKVEIQVASGDGDGVYVDALDALVTKGSKAVFMCNEGVVKQIAVAKADGAYDAIKFVGFDAGTAQSNWIKADGNKAVLLGSVAQDSYAIGYNAVEQCVKAIEGSTAKDVGIAGQWYNKTNIDQLIADNIVYQG